MKKFLVTLVYLALFTWCCGQLMAQGAQADDGIEKLRLAVEAAPDNIKAHQAYIKAMKFDSPDLIKQYDAWIKKYPGSAIFPYAIGNALSNRENPAARPYLKQAIQLDPDYADAYYAMSGDLERWGEFDASYDCLKKAAALDPKNADFVFRFVNTNQIRHDKEKYKELSLKIAKDFPGTVRGAQALYWLANRMDDPREKIAVYEQQKKEFPAASFDWTLYGMDEYFHILLPDQPQKALVLVQEMAKAAPAGDSYAKKTWQGNISMASNVIGINSLLSKGKKTEALAALKKVVVPNRGPLKEFFTLYQSKVLDATGKAKEAYNTMLLAYAKEPAAQLQEMLLGYAKKAGYLEMKAEKDWWYIRDTAAKMAPNFNLYNYFEQTKTSLSDYKGKVVLLTYWFPGCGPCRGEFPHFENVVRKFKDRKDFVYLGINIAPEQDEYVVPFLRSSKYSFIPLRDNQDWKKGPLDNKGMAPMNFLIDGDGRIMFEDFRTDLHNEGSLEMMISGLLNRKADTRKESTAKVNPIRITGTINLKQPVQWLYAHYFFQDRWKNDSAGIVNNRFEFRLPVNEPVEVEFNVKKNKEYQQVSFFAEPGNLLVTIKDTITNITVTGSKSHDEFVKVKELTKSFDDRRNALFKELSQDRSAKKSEEEIDEKFSREYGKIQKEVTETVYRPYLQQHPGSGIAVDVLGSIIGSWVNVDYATLIEAEKLYDGFTPEVKATDAGKDLLRRIRAAKNVSVGAMAVDFTLKDSLDKEISLSSFRGKYVLIDFWASWCVPCRANNPHLIRAYHTFKDQGFTILGVAFDGSERLEKAWRKAMVTDGLPWVNVNDISYPANSSVGRQYNVGSIPQNVLVDPTGKIIARNIEGENLEKELKKILAQK